MKAKADFGVDRSKTVGASRTARPATAAAVEPTTTPAKDKLYAQRVAAREAVRQAELEALAVEHKKRVAAQKLHAAQVRHEKEFLRSIGVPDLSPEKVSREPAAQAQEGRPFES
jgi:hypothetical protein